ncbi:hypothetical protein [Pseudomonas sp. R1-15]|uniref:hypothetical protein n=1 Tax=Pseudomonas sp. R1-15 TaxID=2817399 RepID=UPI003DA8D03C
MTYASVYFSAWTLTEIARQSVAPGMIERAGIIHGQKLSLYGSATNTTHLPRYFKKDQSVQTCLNLAALLTCWVGLGSVTNTIAALALPTMSRSNI